MMTRSKTMLGTLVTLALSATAASGQEAGDPPVASTLFESSDLLRFTLAMDMNRVNKDVRNEEPEYHPATLTYVDEVGDTVTIELEARTRGHFRRNKRNCNFPPLRLNFPNNGIEHTVFAGEDKLKLVRPCQAKRDEYEQYVLKEYIIYRWYNQLTDLSFRVRLAQITYVDTKGKQDTLVKYGFLLEDDDRVAARAGAEIINLPGANMRDPDAPAVLHPLYDLPDTATVVVALFQYMIANTDFSLAHMHNTKLVGYVNGMPYTVPYDFDWSGAVNARYAKPDPLLGTRRVTDRIFRGWCRPQDVIENAGGQFTDAKDSFYQLIANQEGLIDKQKERMTKFLDQFFKTITNPKDFQKKIVGKCRQG